MKLLPNQIETNAKTKLTLALCTVLALSGASLRAADDNDKDKDKGGAGTATTTEAGKAGQLSRTDERFIKEAARGGMMEVHMGKMGVQQGQNAQLKQFAQKLIDDHTKANQELKQLASSKGLTLPEQGAGITGTDSSTSATEAAGAPGTATGTSSDTDRNYVRDKSSDAKDTAHADMKKLHGLSGTEFDREFVRLAVQDHQKDVREFEQASRRVQDQELKSWIDKTLPTLREHLQAAQNLQSQVGAGAPGAAIGTQSDSSRNQSSGTSTSSGTSSGTSGNSGLKNNR
jgi:putative membrane protein